MASQPAPLKSKKSVEQIDTISIIEHPDKPQYGVELDKFGAAAKTSPDEIALVKKLDRHMMPILWLMYFLNFLGMLEHRLACLRGFLTELARS